MARDGRGTPGRQPTKNHVPKLHLADLLRRRRTTLTAFANSLGVTTHATLASWCVRLGVIPPTQEEFDVAFPIALRVNSAKEGVVVLDAPRVVDEQSGAAIDPEVPIDTCGVFIVTSAAETQSTAVEIDTRASQKKLRKKKDDLLAKG